MSILSNLFNSNEKELKKLQPLVDEISRLEPEIKKLSDDDSRAKTEEFKSKNQELGIRNQEFLNQILPEALAVGREAIRRTVGERAFDVQLLAAIALHQGRVAEQKTGEGKTLAAALALYLNSLSGRGCHLITVNDYLARRDAGWYGRALHFLGLKVGCICQEQKSYLYDPDYTDPSQTDDRLAHLRSVDRREAYAADVTYGTNNEFGFDYLRDNMVRDLSKRVQRGHVYAIVDEVDSILIDEARTPLIISSPAEEATSQYQEFAQLVKKLVRGTDYEIDEKLRTAHLSELGINKVERMLGIDNLYEKDFATVHHIEGALRAQTLYHRDKDYVVKDGEVIIVDDFTGRLMVGRRYSGGLHQAIEAKEGAEVQRESRTLATISFQNYFRMYEKLAGMTGTAATEAEEFQKIYGLETIVVPSNRPLIREDHSDVVYKTVAAKLRAIVDEISLCRERGQPVLVGTVSIENNELLHKLLERRRVPHEVLNAKHHEKEAQIIAQAGRKGAVTVATNMAGRGVDIVLGGKRPPADENQESGIKNQGWEEESTAVKAQGGLHVIGTERHESRRIDNQLRGRSGRQGDPGSSRFFVSLQDDLMRIFGGARVEAIMDRLGIEENIPIENKLVSRSIEQAQKRVEGHNFDIRKNLVEYDDVLNKQREIVYRLREKVLRLNSSPPPVASEEVENWLLTKLSPYLENIEKLWEEKEKEFGEAIWPRIVRAVSLPVIDTLWMEHLDGLEGLRQGVGLRGYSGAEPLVAYKKEAHQLFERLISQIWSLVARRIEGVTAVPSFPQEPRRRMILERPELETGVKREAAEVRGDRKPSSETYVRGAEKVGRNDPCPCGSGKKYKRCCGRNR